MNTGDSRHINTKKINILLFYFDADMKAIDLKTS